METTNKIEIEFIHLCQNGHLIRAQQLLQLNPDINISAGDDCAFCWACCNGYLHVCQWLLQIKPDINISSDDIKYSFRWACSCAFSNKHLNVAKWLQSLKPYLYVLEYDENGKYIGYKIREKEEANWEKRKYLVWLASNNCPEQNKNNLLYKLPIDVSRIVVGYC